MADYKKPFMDLNNYVPDVYKNPVLKGLISNLFNRFLTKKESTPIYGMVGDLDATVKVKYSRLDTNIELDIYVTVIDPARVVDGEELTLTVFDVENQILEVSSSVGGETGQIILGQKQKVQNKFIVAPRLVSSKLARMLKPGRKYTIQFSVERSQANVPFISEMNIDREENQIIPFNVAQMADGNKQLFGFNDVMNRLRTLGIPVERYLEWGRQQSFNFNLPINYDKFANFSRYYWYGHLDLIFDYLVVDRPQQSTPYSFSNSKFGLALGTTLKTPIVKRVTGLVPTRTDLSLVGLNSVNTASITITVVPQMFLADHINREMYFDVVQLPSGERVIQYIHSGGNVYTFGVDGQNYIIDALSVTVNFSAERLLVGERFKITIKPELTEVEPTQFYFSNDAVTFLQPNAVDNCYVVQFSGKPYEFIKGYNPDFLPQYYTIERLANGATNDWQRDNFWIHEDDVAKFNDNNLPGHPSFFNNVFISQLKQAKRPIIEFNAAVQLNKYITSDGKFADDQFEYGALIGSVGTPYVQIKGDFNQAPKFDLYYHTGVHTNEALPLISYEVGDTYDTELKLYVSTNSWGQLQFNCALFTTDEKLYCYREANLLKTAWDGSSIGYPVYVYKDETGKLISLTYKDIEGTAWQFADVNYISPLVAAFLSLTSTYPINAEIYSEADDIVNDWRPANVSRIIIDINQMPEGAWVYPKNKYMNPFFENKKVIPYNELFSHFISIINENEKNNSTEFFNPYRFITNRDLGQGGTIKNFDKNFELFSAIHYLSNVSVPAIIDFAKHQYQVLLNEVDTFARNNIVEFLTKGRVKISNDPQRYGQDYILDTRFTENETGLETFFVDLQDFLATRGLNVFSDTTAGVKNWIMTLPYLGMSSLVKPNISFSSLVGFPPTDNTPVLMHHDGHISIPISLDQRETLGLITTEYMFYDEFGRLIKVNSTARDNDPEGTLLFQNVVGPTRPAVPFNGQFWFDTVNNILWFFNGGPLTSAQPSEANVGDYWYNYSSTNVLQWDGNQWQVSSIDPHHFWVPIDLSYFSNKFRFMLEEKLYDGCHYDQGKLKSEFFQFDKPTLNSSLEPEFIKYTIREGLPSYEPSYYNPQNAFTWNYSRVKFPYVDAETGCWTEIYLQHCGTSRPDIEPWKLFDIANKNEYVNPTTGLDFDQTYKDYSGNQRWLPQLWQDILAYLPVSPRPERKLCVNPNNGKLLPPYVSSLNLISVHALTTTIPDGVSNIFKFSDGYVSEMIWRQSIDYGYDYLKALYSLDPLMFITATWGLNYTEPVNDYSFHRRYGKIANNGEILLHGTQSTVNLEKLIVKIADKLIQTLTLTVANVQNDKIKFLVNDGINQDYVYFNTNNRYEVKDFFGAKLTFIEREPQEYNIGDKIVIKNNTTIERTNYPVYRVNGINQWFVNFCRFKNISLIDSDVVRVLKSTQMQLGYRVGGFVANDSMTLVTNARLTADDYTTHIKKSAGVRDAWFDALHIQIVGIGQKSYQDPNNPKLYYPTEKADDWTFRIQTLNPFHPVLKFYKANTTEVETFQAFSAAHCKLHWTKSYARETLLSSTTPIVVRGLQNLIDVVFGYAAYLDSIGWKFVNGLDIAVDPDTGRPMDWQYQMERFIDRLYAGSFLPNSANTAGATGDVPAPAGGQTIMNPSPIKMWFAAETGTIAPFETSIDPYLSQALYDVYGNIIDVNNILILRDNEISELKSINDIIGGAHIMIDEYEHVVLLSDYLIGPNEIMFNKFAGVHRSNILFSGERTQNYTGRLSTPGYYLDGHALRENMETSVGNFKSFYDSSRYIIPSPVTDEAKKLLGYNNPAFFSDVTVSEKTKFEFWKGLLFNKGTNQSINAFFNSSLFKKMKTDEFWAFKVAEYGQNTPRAYPEMKVRLSDVNTYLTKFFFSNTSRPGFTQVSPTDETRWMSYVDITQHNHFESTSVCKTYHEFKAGDVIKLSNMTDAVKVCRLIDAAGNIGVVVRNNPSDNLIKFQKNVYNGIADLIREPLVEGTSYKRLNSQAIQFLTDSANEGVIVEIECIGLPYQYFDPIKLIDYKNNVVTDDIQIWDPARGIHNTTFLGDVSIMWPSDPAIYNNSTSTTNNSNFDSNRAWAEEHVGKMWWDTTALGYKHYYDPILIPNVDARLAIWGDIADYASIDVYQWVKSPVKPSDYVDYASNAANGLSGEPALQKTYFKVREWESRPVAWATTITANPPSFNSNNPNNLTSTRSLFVSGNQLVLSNGSWNDFEITVGVSKISGGIFSQTNDNLSKYNLASNLIKPFGEAVTTGSPYNVLGSSFDPNAVLMKEKLQYSSPSFAITKDALESDDAIGEYIIFAKTDIDGSYVTLTNTSNSLTTPEIRQIILPLGFNENISQSFNIDLTFAVMGITITAQYNPIVVSGTTSGTSFNGETPTVSTNDSNDGLGLAITGLHGTLFVRTTGEWTYRYTGGVLASSSAIETFTVVGDSDIVIVPNGTMNSNFTVANINAALDGTTSSVYSKDFTTLAAKIANGLADVDNEIFIRSAVPCVINIDFKFRNKFGNIIDINSREVPVIDAEQIGVTNATVPVVNDLLPETDPNYITYPFLTDWYEGWFIYDEPDVADVLNDRLSPNNQYYPVVGDFLPVSDVFYSLGGQSVQKISKERLDFISGVKTYTLANGTTVSKIQDSWTPWHQLSDRTIKKFMTQIEVIDFSSELLFTNNIRVFVNGFETTDYSLVDGVVTITPRSERNNVSDICLGDEVIVKYYSYKPTSAQLSTGTNVDITEQVSYKSTVDYTVVTTQNEETGNIETTTYYFWVKNINSSYMGKIPTINVKDGILNTNKDAYACFPIIEEDDESYHVISFYNLKSMISADDQFKLQFIRDFSFRDTSTDQKKKNIHEEWIIQQASQPTTINAQLWAKLIDSACGETASGRTIPSSSIAAFDAVHGTFCRYGFGEDQILADSIDIFGIIVDIFTKLKNDGNFTYYKFTSTSDDNYGYDNIARYIQGSAAMRFILNKLYTEADATLVNLIFFTVLEHALSKNPKMKDVFKTSYIAVVTNKLIGH